jgi:acyl-CoA thioester hydrolase
VDNLSFGITTRVRFAETDAQGIAHNASFIVWFELARVEYLREHTGGYQRLRDAGIEALVLETHVRHLEPAHFDEVLTVRTACSDVRGARFRFDYVVERDGKAIADGWTQHACVDPHTMRPTRVPEWLKDALTSAVSASSSSQATSTSA